MQTIDNDSDIEVLLDRYYVKEGAISRKELASEFEHLLNQYGPLVKSYPNCHALSHNGNNDRVIRHHLGDRLPSCSLGYASYDWLDGFNKVHRSLFDHCMYFAYGILTVPYYDIGDILEEITYAIEDISYEKLDYPLWADGAIPYIISMDGAPYNEPAIWGDDFRRISTSDALSCELKTCALEVDGASVTEPWENIKNIVYGLPCSGQLNPWFTKDTLRELKKFHKILESNEVYGPLKGVI